MFLSLGSINVWWNTSKKPSCHTSVRKGWNVLSVIPWPWGESSPSSSTGPCDSAWQILFFLTNFWRLYPIQTHFLGIYLSRKLFSMWSVFVCNWNLWAGPWIYKVWYNAESSEKRVHVIQIKYSVFSLISWQWGTHLGQCYSCKGICWTWVVQCLQHSQSIHNQNIWTTAELLTFFYEDLNTTCLMSLQTTSQSMKFHKNISVWTSWMSVCAWRRSHGNTVWLTN